MSFDPTRAAEKAKQSLALKKGRNYTPRKSKLEPHRHEIVRMYTQGVSLEVIVEHLMIEHQQSVVRSTVHRYLKSIGVTRYG